MTTSWADLPNAEYIDLLFDSVKREPEAWGALFHTSNGNYTIEMSAHDVWQSVRNEIESTDRKLYDIFLDVMSHASDVAGHGTHAFYVVTESLAAFVAYDDCAYMLDSDPSELKLLAAFGNIRATLMVPACIVLSKEKENEHC